MFTWRKKYEGGFVEWDVVLHVLRHAKADTWYNEKKTCEERVG